MGIYDREYMEKGSGGPGIASWTMVTWLLIANGVAFLIQHLIFDNAHGTGLDVSRDPLFSGQIWRLLTYQFCHDSPGHFIANMIGLFFVGRILEQILGRKHILPVYLLSGGAGAVAFLLWDLVTPTVDSVIGASGAVLGILAAFVTLIPEERISLLFLPFQFKVKYLGWVVLAINLLGLIAFSDSKVSYITHLGGMAGGWVYVRLILPELRRREMRGPSPGRKKKRLRSEPDASGARKERRKKEKDSVYLNKQVDAILEKINEHGMHSLSAEERRILEKSSEKLSRKLGDK